MTRDHGWGWFGSETGGSPHISPSEDATAPIEELACLADTPDLPPEVARWLLDQNHELIATSLAFNEETSKELLAAIAEKFPTLERLVGRNSHSPARLKDPIPLREHTTYSLEVYLDEVGATETERSLLYEEHAAVPPPGGPPLGEVWSRIRSQR